MRPLLYTSAVILAMTISSVALSQYELKNVVTLSGDAKYSDFIVSPNFEKIALLDLEYNKLLLLNKQLIKKSIGKNTIVQPKVLLHADDSVTKFLEGSFPVWSSDNKTISFQDYKSLNSMYCSVNTSLSNPFVKAEELSDVPIQYTFPSYSMEDWKNETKKRYAVFNEETKSIEAFTSTNQNHKWKVSKLDGDYYNIIISPDGKKLVCNNGADMIVLGTDPGSPIHFNLGYGIPTGWDPGSKLILFYFDEGDGHTIDESNIYIIDFEGKQRSVLTKSEHGKIYTNPHWFEKDKVVFNEEASNKVLMGQLSKKE